MTSLSLDVNSVSPGLLLNLGGEEETSKVPKNRGQRVRGVESNRRERKNVLRRDSATVLNGVTFITMKNGKFSLTGINWSQW